MADTGFRPPPRPKTCLDNNKLKLYAPNTKGKMASLGFGLFKNNPRITVYTNDSEDTVDYGKITANMDLKTFYALLQLIRTAANFTGEFREKIDNKNFTWPGGQRSEKPTVVSSTIVSKDAEGVVYLTIQAKSRPVIKFQFGEDEYHNFIRNDGTPLSRGEGSQRVALGYVTLMETMMAHMAVINYVEPEQKPQGSGGGFQRGGGGGNGGGFQQRGGGGAPKPAAEDDMDGLESW